MRRRGLWRSFLKSHNQAADAVFACKGMNSLSNRLLRGMGQTEHGSVHMAGGLALLANHNSLQGKVAEESLDALLDSKHGLYPKA